MSKKEKLKRQKEKQDLLKKELELQQQQEIEDAKAGMSKAGMKLIKKSKKEKNKKSDGKLLLFLKLLMLIPFTYSGVFYGGVTVVGIASGMMDRMDGSGKPMQSWVAAAMGIGALLILVGIILAFYNKYFSSFTAILAGTLSYMRSSVFIVNEIKDKLSVVSAIPGSEDMDKTYMLRHYPIMIVLLISIIMTVIIIIRLIKKKKRLKRERENAPVKSIIEG